MKRGLLESDVKVKVPLACCQWNIQVTKTICTQCLAQEYGSVQKTVDGIRKGLIIGAALRVGCMPGDILSTHCCFGNRSAPSRYSSWAQAVIVMTAIIIIIEVAFKERGSCKMQKISRGNVLRFQIESMDVSHGSSLKMAAGLHDKIRRLFIAAECPGTDEITRPLMATLFTAKTWLQWSEEMLSLVPFFSQASHRERNVFCLQYSLGYLWLGCLSKRRHAKFVSCQISVLSIFNHSSKQI